MNFSHFLQLMIVLLYDGVLGVNSLVVTCSFQFYLSKVYYTTNNSNYISFVWLVPMNYIYCSQCHLFCLLCQIFCSLIFYFSILSNIHNYYLYFKLNDFTLTNFVSILLFALFQNGNPQQNLWNFSSIKHVLS